MLLALLTDQVDAMPASTEKGKQLVLPPAMSLGLLGFGGSYGTRCQEISF
jgi:hypothetical protein